MGVFQNYLATKRLKYRLITMTARELYDRVDEHGLGSLNLSELIQFGIVVKETAAVMGYLEMIVKHVTNKEKIAAASSPPTTPDDPHKEGMFL